LGRRINIAGCWNDGCVTLIGTNHEADFTR
jgi:hypothetical protein